MTAVKRKTTSSSTSSKTKTKAAKSSTPKLVSKKTASKAVKVGSKLTLKSAGDRTITLHTTANPKRPSSAAYQSYALYKDGMTVASFIEKGGSFADLRFDQSKGFIELSPATANSDAE